MKLEDMLAYKMAMAASDLSESLYNVYASYGLVMPEWRIMATLGHFSPDSKVMSAKALSQATRLDKVSVSRALKRMEHNGLICKTLSKNDGRFFDVALSPRGEAMYSEIIPKIRLWQQSKLKNITDSEYEIFLKVIDALRP